MANDGGVRPGWYADPDDASGLRWWDGAAWTDHRVAAVSERAAPRGLRPVGEFISASFRAIGASIKPLALLAAVAVVPLVVALVLADAQLGFSDWLTEVVDATVATEPGQDVVFPQWDVNPASVAIWGVAIAILYLFAYTVLPLAATPRSSTSTGVPLEGAEVSSSFGRRPPQLRTTARRAPGSNTTSNCATLTAISRLTRPFSRSTSAR